MVKALIANALAWVLVLGFPAWAYWDNIHAEAARVTRALHGFPSR